MVAVLPARKVQAWLLSYWRNKITGSGYGCCPAGPKSPGMVVVLLAQKKKKKKKKKNIYIYIYIYIYITRIIFVLSKSSDTFIALPGPSILTTTQKQRCKRASNFIQYTEETVSTVITRMANGPKLHSQIPKIQELSGESSKSRSNDPLRPFLPRPGLNWPQEGNVKKSRQKPQERNLPTKKKRGGGKKEEDGEDGTEVPRTLSNTTSPLNTPAHA